MPLSSTSRRILLGACLVLTMAAAPGAVQALNETTAPAPRSVEVDTLQFSGTPGQPLIVQLPRQIGRRTVQRYDPVRLPALSLLVDRAFFWDTRTSDAGRHELQLRAHYHSAPSEEVVVVVELSDQQEE